MPKFLQIRNAQILTRSSSRTCDIICENGRITSIRETNVGARSSPRFQKKIEEFDAKRLIVLPGLIDCHAHLFSLGMIHEMVDLRDARSVKEMQKRVKDFLNRTNGGHSWIMGRGWDQDLFSTKSFPSKEDLDQVTQSRPTILTRICGHIAVLNSAALKRIKSLSEFSSELVPIGENGEAIGIVKEEALAHVLNQIPSPSISNLKRYFLVAQSVAVRSGLIGVHCILSDNWKAELSAIRSLESSGDLVLKTSLFLPISALKTVEQMKKRERRRLLTGSSFIALGFKVFADGSLGARTAALLRPYSDDSQNRGILNYRMKELVQIAKRVRRLRMILATHAIGDRAVKQVTKAYKHASIEADNNFRIEHCSVLSQELISALDGFVVSVQPAFATSDYWIGDRLGHHEGRIAYPLRSLLRSKKEKVIAGSDSPVEDISPIRGISSSMNNPLKKESLDLRQALSLYTTNAAGKSPLTLLSGRIANGFECSLTILDALDVEKIPWAKVKMVFIDGKAQR